MRAELIIYGAAIAIVLAVSGVVAWSKGAPAISPAALQRAFTSIGFAPGLVRTIEGTTYRVDKVSVTADGEWIVVRVLPRRVSGGR
jgi:hypothetical protein